MYTCYSFFTKSYLNNFVFQVHNLKQLPHRLKKVDVILADFLGDCVVGQGDQMEQVIEARDRFLVSNGMYKYEYTILTSIFPYIQIFICINKFVQA